jgi:hypothetical protein
LPQASAPLELRQLQIILLRESLSLRAQAAVAEAHKALSLAFLQY